MMGRSRTRATIASTLLLWIVVIASPADAAADDPWEEVSTPNPGTFGSFANELHAVEGIAANDVWAVGAFDTGPYLTSRATLALHFDGTSWSTVSTPNPDGAGTGVDIDRHLLFDVEALASNDVWAVGVGESIDQLGALSVVLHWDGTAWSSVDVPRLGDEIALNSLRAVSAVSPTDIWAVGSYTLYEGFTTGTLTLHWNGSAWSLVSNPCNASEDIVAISANDVWAVGVDTCHWDGSSWTAIPNAADPSNGYVTLLSVSASPAGDLLAVGFRSISYFSGYIYSVRIERWNGSSWVTDSPNTTGDHLDGVLSLSATDAWAVGSNFGNPLIMHWDGSTWTAVADVPSPGDGAYLNAVSAAGSDLWAVGISFGSDVIGRNLALRSSGSTPPPGSDIATVSGIVTGRGGRLISGGIVSWTGPQTGSTTTAANGSYQFTSSAGGTYSVTASVVGCRRTVTSTVTAALGQSVVLNFGLRC